MYLSGAKYRLGKVGLNKPSNETKVTMILLTNIDPIGLDVHEVEFNLSSLSFFNRSTTNKKLEIWIPKKNQDNVYKLFKTIPKAPFYFSIMIGSSNILRKWSIINFAKLIHYCTEEYHAFCFILGGKEEEEKGCKLENLHPSHSLNLCVKLSLLESCEIIKKSNLYIGNDTGLMHIASATTTPIIEISAFFIDGFKEHTNSPKRWGPWMTPHKIVQPIEKISDIPMDCVTFKMVKQALDELIEEVLKKNINQKESLF
jgi:ADP-heptose:LPS heptosyltransferase